VILLHRITPMIIAITTIASFGILIYSHTPIGLPLLFTVLASPMLFARLLKWEWQLASFWVFLGIPLFFLVSSIFFFLFLEVEAVKIALGVFVTFGIWLFAENVFAFYHLPSTYQAYALEYLSLVLFVVSGFFFTSGAYAVQIFLQLPVWVPALAVFWVVLFSSTAVFWVSKVSSSVSNLFAFSGALLMTELYIALAMLPTSFITSAAAFSVFLYLYLGLTRVHVLEKISKKVLMRYLRTAVILLAIIFASARWI